MSTSRPQSNGIGPFILSGIGSGMIGGSCGSNVIEVVALAVGIHLIVSVFILVLRETK